MSAFPNKAKAKDGGPSPVIKTHYTSKPIPIPDSFLSTSAENVGQVTYNKIDFSKTSLPEYTGHLRRRTRQRPQPHRMHRAHQARTTQRRRRRPRRRERWLAARDGKCGTSRRISSYGLQELRPHHMGREDRRAQAADAVSPRRTGPDRLGCY